jgi:AcrR family transcriptional regulator
MTAVLKRNPGRPPDEALRERRCCAILKEASAVFAKHGFGETDVQWIADALGISKGTIYRYFPSKEKLFMAAVHDGIDRMHREIDAAGIGIDDHLEEIRVRVVAYLRFFKKNPQLVELFIQERAEFRDQKTPIYFQHRDARKGPWRQRLADLIAAGRLRNVPMERIIDVLGDLMYGTMFTNHFAGRDKPYAAQAQDILDIVFHGILSEKERSRDRSSNLTGTPNGNGKHRR